MQNPEFKTCPFCKEAIRLAAAKCRYCGEWLEQAATAQSIQPNILETSVEPVPIVTRPILKPAPIPAVKATAETPHPSQNDLILGEKVFRDLAEQLNIYPGRDQWEYEFLKQSKPAETLPKQFLDDLWDASDKTGRKTNNPDEDMEIGASVFRQLAEKLKRYPLEEEWVNAFQARKGSKTSVPAMTLRQTWLAVDASGRTPLEEHDKDKKTAGQLSGLKLLNGILLGLFLFGIIGIMMNGDAFTPKNIGSNFIVLLVSLCPLSGFLAASQPDNRTRRNFAKFANGLMAGLMILCSIVPIYAIVVSLFQKNGKFQGSAVITIIFMLLLVGLPAFMNLKAFWKEKPNQKTTPDNQEIKSASPTPPLSPAPGSEPQRQITPHPSVAVKAAAPERLLSAYRQLSAATGIRRSFSTGIDLAVCVILVYATIVNDFIPSRYVDILGFLPLAYFVFRDSVGGRSLGKRITGILLVSEKTDTAMSPGKALLRNLFILSPIALAILVVFMIGSPVAGSFGPWAMIAGLIASFMGRDALFHLIALNVRQSK